MLPKNWLSKMIVVLALLVLVVGVVQADTRAAPLAPSAGYAIPWWSLDSGGGASQGGAFILTGTVGQADAGVGVGGPYILAGGFFSGSPPYRMFMPLVRR